MPNAPHRSLKLRPARLALGIVLAAAGFAGLGAGLALTIEPYPYDTSLAVGMPVGLLLGCGGLGVMLVGAWLCAVAFERSPRP